MTLRRAGPADIPSILALQQAAYARNRDILGVEPMPLLADYADIVASHEIWLAEGTDALEGVLILQARPDDLLVWSVAVTPASQGSGVGNKLLAQAEHRARALNRSRLRLYTGEPLTGNIAWYQRHGFVCERVERLCDRRIVHMVKDLDPA